MKMVRFFAFLLLTEAAAVLLFLLCQMVLHLNPFGLNVNFILSAGGFAFGLIGGMGSLPGAKRAGIAPTLPIMALVALTTGAAVLAYYYATFIILLARMGLVGSGIGFGDFLDATVGHTQYSGSMSSDTSSDIGGWGYALFASHIAWAMMISILWLTNLRKVAHCERCERYFEQREKRELLFADAAELQQLAHSLPKPSAERASQLLRMPQTPSYTPEAGVVRFEIRHSECPGCREQDATETIEIHNGKGFAGAQTHSYRWRTSGAYRATPDADMPPPPSAPQRPAFGRRGLG
jgi:hypothetical protein